MSIAGLGTYSSSGYYYKAVTKSRSGSLSNVSDDYLSKEIPKDDPMHDFKEAARKAVTSSPYCKCIIANIKTEELYASQNDAGEMAYSYEKTEQSFQIFIKYDGHDKTYSVKGYDKDGNSFEKDINPEEVDPEYADFPEFSTLCMYFEHTEQTSEFLADDYFDTDDILEKMNYLEKVNNLRNENVMDKAKSMIDYANRLFDDFRQMMNAKEDINSLFEPYFMKFLSMDITQIEQSEEPDVTERLSDVHSSEKIKEEKAEDEQVTPLGIGFAKAGEMGYGMSASLVTKPGSDDTIIRVKVATGSGSETIDVNLSNFDPKNATPVEMFAYCQYKDANGEGVNSKWGSWNAMKTVMSPTDGTDFGSLDNIMNKKMNWTDALAKSKTILGNEKTKETISAADLLKLFEETHTLTAQELKEEKDWREMSDDEWDKLLEGIDKYIDAFKERIKQLKEMQDKAAQKAALEADSDMRATAASAAALSAAANGLGGTSEADAESQTEEGVLTEDGVKHEKNWTKNLKTDDQTVLRTAKEAQEMEKKAMSRFEEVQLTDTTTVGVSKTDTGTECASVEEDENKEKVWTITVFGEDGIVSTRCQNGKILDSWEIKYTNPNDAKKVQDFIGRFEKDANLIFSGSKDFWEEFLSSDMDADSIFAAHAEVFDKAAPDAPPIVKNAWMNAAKETGYLEGGKMNHISQLLVCQVINRENGVEDYQNVFGNSVASALQAAKELLYDLENPLTPESERSESVRMYREQEKEFYRKFIENLDEISGILVGDENNMYIDKEKALKYASQLEPVDDIASILK